MGLRKIIYLTVIEIKYITINRLGDLAKRKKSSWEGCLN